VTVTLITSRREDSDGKTITRSEGGEVPSNLFRVGVIYQTVFYGPTHTEKERQEEREREKETVRRLSASCGSVKYSRTLEIASNRHRGADET